MRTSAATPIDDQRRANERYHANEWYCANEW
jgi:hypothetical protein